MKNDKTKTVSELYIQEMDSVGSVSGGKYIYLQDTISHEISVNSKTLKIPKDITPYESAKLSQFLFVVSRCPLSCNWDLVQEFEIQRLFE